MVFANFFDVHILGVERWARDFAASLRGPSARLRGGAKTIAIEHDPLPALTFEDDAVVEDVAVLARAKNLVLGCRVSAVRAVRSIKRGGHGQLLALGKEALVRWDEGALVYIEEAVLHERVIPPASLQVAAAPGKIL